MPRGRPRKPIELHRLQGTYRPDRHKDWAEFTETELPLIGDAPKHLTARQKKMWQELKMASYPGVLRISDSFYLEITSGLLDQYRHNPDFTSTQLTILIKLLGQMGFGLQDRLKMGIEPKKKVKDDNDFQFLNS